MHRASLRSVWKVKAPKFGQYFTSGHVQHSIPPRHKKTMKNWLSYSQKWHTNLIFGFQITITNSLLMSQVCPQIVYRYWPLQLWWLLGSLQSWTKRQSLSATLTDIISIITLTACQRQQTYNQSLTNTCSRAQLHTYNQSWIILMYSPPLPTRRLPAPQIRLNSRPLCTIQIIVLYLY